MLYSHHSSRRNSAYLALRLSEVRLQSLRIFFGLLAVSCLLYVCDQPKLSISCLSGGLVALVPQAFFAEFVLKKRLGLSQPLVLWRFYYAEAVKWLLTVVLFAFVLKKVASADPLYVLLVYVLVLTVNQYGLIKRSN